MTQQELVMERKRVVVLAKSRKEGQRCVAGREIIGGDPNQPCSVGPWIRPVSNRDKGGLDVGEMLLSSGREVQVMDFVEVYLTGPADDRYQPENWRIDDSQRWCDLGNMNVKPFLSVLQESPRDLWGDSSDRVAHSYLEFIKPPSQSLYMIRPTNLRVRLFRGYRNHRKTQAVFEYNGIEYHFSITDPVIHDRYQGQIPEPNAAPLEFPLPCGDACYLCVSLGGEYRGDHYKLVATIFENAP